MFQTPTPNVGSPGMGGSPKRGAPSFPTPPRWGRTDTDPQEVGARMVAVQMQDLSKQDLKAIQYSGKPGEAKAWMYVASNTLEDALGDAAARLMDTNHTEAYSQAEWDCMEDWQKYYVHEVDKAIHGVVLRCIMRDTVTGNTLLQNVMNHNDSIRKSGTLLCHFIMQAQNNMSYEEVKLVMRDIVSLKMGPNDDADELRAVVTSLHTKWESIPEAMREPQHKLFEYLLNVMPSTCKEQRISLETNINTRRTMGDSLPSYEQFAAGIVTTVLQQAQAKTQPPLTLVTHSPQKDSKRRCLNCSSTEHWSWHCPNRCPKCGLAFCGFQNTRRGRAWSG